MAMDVLIRRLGGVARTFELHEHGFTEEIITAFVAHGRVIRVRQGWYATHDTPPLAVAAIRAGGRLACVSALAHHGLVEPGGPLHISVGRSGNPRAAAGVVVHWTRRDLAGDRVAVSAEEAWKQARVCRAVRAGTLEP